MNAFRHPLALLIASLLPCTASAQCAITVQSIMFGNIDPSLTTPARTISEYTITCAQSASLTIAIGPSLVTGKVTDRRLQHAYRQASLSYNLYQDASGTQVWGDGAGAQPLQVEVNAQTTFSGRIFAEVYPQPDAWIGDYSDTVVFTVLP